MSTVLNATLLDAFCIVCVERIILKALVAVKSILNQESVDETVFKAIILAFTCPEVKAFSLFADLAFGLVLITRKTTIQTAVLFASIEIGQRVVFKTVDANAFHVTQVAVLNVTGIFLARLSPIIARERIVSSNTLGTFLFRACFTVFQGAVLIAFEIAACDDEPCTALPTKSVAHQLAVWNCGRKALHFLREIRVPGNTFCTGTGIIETRLAVLMGAFDT